MTLWQLTLNIIITSLLATLVATIIILTLFRFGFNGKSLYAILISRTYSGVLLILLLFLILVIFLLTKDTSYLSPEKLAIYFRELFISVIIVVSSIITWKTLKTLKSIIELVKYYPIKMEQKNSLLKWEQGDITGFYELCEEYYFRKGLHPEIRSVLEEKLRQIQQKRKLAGIQSNMDDKYEEAQLKSIYRLSKKLEEDDEPLWTNQGLQQTIQIEYKVVVATDSEEFQPTQQSRQAQLEMHQKIENQPTLNGNYVKLKFLLHKRLENNYAHH